jgi:DNA-binding response OmpR family regulator
MPADGVPFRPVSGRNVNVLVVDDQEVIRDTLQTALDDEGFTVETAANGREALDILERWKPSVILLDLMMPVMDGWAFRAEQKRSGSTVPVVLLSAAGELAGHQKTLDAAAVIAKPFDIDRVISTIEGVC